MSQHVELVRSVPAFRWVPRGEARPAIGGRADTSSYARTFSLAGIVALLAVLAAQLLVPHLLQRASVGLAVTGILFGVPHGAVDHMVPFWTSSTRPTVSRMAAVVGQYLCIASLAAGALVIAPNIAVTAFLLASIVHFGCAESQFLATGMIGIAPTSVRHIIGSLGHGAAVVVLPLGLWHNQVAEVLGPLAPAYRTDRFAELLALLAAVVLGLNGALALDALRRKRFAEALQIALVAAVFVAVPPLAAFAVYFGFWHALRHTGRLLALPGPGGCRLPIAVAVRRYLRHAALPTLAVAIALPVIWSTSPGPVVSGSVVVLLALTFPHMRTVAALDRWQARARADAQSGSTP